jgi:hypothetical protein
VTVPVEFTHAASIFACVLISDWGTVPLPAGVVARAWPFEGLTRFMALVKALAMAVCARAVPDDETCVASEANPARA